MEIIKKKVQSWWDSCPCCSKSTTSPWGTKEFFEQVDLYKDTLESFTNMIADYPRWRGKRILEIGVGLGKDFSRFAANGAMATGIDLSGRSLSLAKQRLEIFNLKGNFCIADAENLPFKEDVFDLVFSWGVLHHTPDTQKAINELYKCLKHGGNAIVMLYNKYSLANFQHFMTKLKVRLISLFGLNLLLSIRRLLLPWRWFKEPNPVLTGLEKLNPDDLLAALTDGIGNPLSKVYSRNQAKRMFLKFLNIKINAYESKDASYMRIFNLFKALEKYFGWFMVIEAKK